MQDISRSVVARDLPIPWSSQRLMFDRRFAERTGRFEFLFKQKAAHFGGTPIFKK